MEIIEQIGSYAGLAAVLGLAVLSALYFSQARDVRRLREWAGRAPERTGEPSAVQAQRVVAQPVPRPPGQGAQAGAAAASATGAAPATASGPAAPATPAGARAAQPGGVSQDTVVHPPPAGPGATGQDGAKEEEGDDDAKDGDAVAPAAAAGAGAAAAAAAGSGADDDDEDADDEHFREDVEDDDEADAPPPGEEEEEEGDSEDDDDFGDDDEDDYDEDTGDRPAVAAPNLPPSRPLTAAGARRPVPPPALPPRAPPPGRGNATSSIIPPYSQSRPGGQPVTAAQEPSGRRTAIMALVGGLLLLVGVGFGATQLLGDNEEGGAQPAGQPTGQGGSGGGDGAGQGAGNRRRAAVDPGSVTVAVLNGTTVPGLAAQIGDSIESQGFQLGTITNSTDQQRAESVVLYAPGAENEARDVARRLNISQREEADPDSQGLAGDATVIVVTGQDKTR